MKPKTLAFLTLLALVVSAALFFLFILPVRDESPAAVAARVRSPEDPALHAPVAAPIPEVVAGRLPRPAEETGQAVTDGRQVVDVVPLTGRVVDEDGAPVAGAIVTWTPSFVLDHPASGDTWARDRVQALLGETLRTATDARGRFQLDTGEAPLAGSVLWATHSRFLASPLVFDDEPSTGSVLTLAGAPAVAARVLDEAGGVRGADVYQLGIVQDLPDLDPEQASALSALIRTHETDTEGRAVLHPFPGRSGLRAREGGRASRARIETLAGEITLRLCETFLASGTVSAADGVDPECRVVVGARFGHILEELQTAPVTREGTWGPVEVPLVAAEEYEFSLGGGAVIPAVETLAPPAAGSHVVVDFTAETGTGLWAIVVDPAGEVLFDAEVEARWRTPEYRWRSVRARPYPPDHQHAGYVKVRGVPPGSVVLDGRCAGYVSRATAPIEVPEPDPVTAEIQLDPAARLRGVVLFRGEPVPTFELCYWNPGVYPPSAWKETFANREDGSFEVDDAPTGQLLVLASAPDLPRSSTELVHVEPGETADVTLELREGIPGRGRVVRQSDGAPIPEARVQRYSNEGQRVVAYWGSPAPVDRTGAFELDGFVPGLNVVEALADGYASAWAWATAGEDGVDFRTITLARRQELVVHLRGADPAELDDYRLNVIGADEVNGVRFSQDAVAEAGPVAPYPRYSLVLRKNEAYVQQMGVDLVPGQDWTFAFDLAGPSRVSVRVVAEAHELPDGLRACGQGQGDAGEARVVKSPVLEVPTDGSRGEGTATLAGLPTGHASLWVEDAGGRALARASAFLEGGDESVTLRLDSSQTRFRLLDSSGDPISGAVIYLRPPSQRSRYLTQATTDSEGWASVSALAPGRYYLIAHHQTLGSAPFEVERVEGSDEPIALVFETGATLTVRVGGGEGPVVGAACNLSAFDGYLDLPHKSSAADGTATWDLLGPGPYTVSVSHPHRWDVALPVELGAGPRTIDVLLRPLSALEVVVRDRDDSPAPGVAVELEATELGETVGDWIDAGRVPAPATGMRTDGRGRLEVVGLPTGPYRWSAGGSSGFAEVGRETTRLDVRLP